MTMTRLHKGLLFFAIAMAVFSLGRALLLFLYPDQFAQLTTGRILAAFATGLRFDGATVVRVFALPLLLMVLPWRRLDEGRGFAALAWLMWCGAVLMSLLLVSDIIYFDEVRRHISYELVLLGNDWQFVWDFAFGVYWWALLLFAAYAAALFWLWRRILRVPLRPMRRAAVQYAVLFVALVIIGRGGIGGKAVGIIDAYADGDSDYGHLALNGVYTTMVFSLHMDKVDHHTYATEKAVQILAERRPGLDPAWPMVQRYDAAPTGRNVVFVLLESWNFDYVDSFAGKGIGATPNFDALAAEGLKFTRFYAAGQRSIEGIQTTLTGIPALKGMPRLDTGIGVSNFTRLGAMAERHGYHTLFVQSSDRDSFKIQGVARAAGFRDFYGKEDIPLLLKYPDPKAAIFGWDYDMLQFLKGKIDAAGQPFLAYAFTGTTHTPYPALEGHVIRQPHDADGESGYINALHYADWSLGEFMRAARAQPWFSNTVFIFTADHTTHWQRGGLLQQFHIPLLIYAPGIIAPGVSTAVGSQLDVMPTIVDLLGLPDEFSSLGDSLLRKQDGLAFLIAGGQRISLVGEKGYVSHDLNRRLASGGTEDKSYLDALERQLLARDQLSYELLRDNRWAK